MIHAGKIFDALASDVRRKILAYLSETEMSAGEIAEYFDISKPSLSKHLSILQNAGLVESDKRGQFVHYKLVEHNLINTLNGYLQDVCSVAKPIKQASKAKAEEKTKEKTGSHKT